MLAGQPWFENLITELYIPGQALFKEGEPPQALYVILDGKVAIVKNTGDATPLVLSYHGEDAIVGEIALLSDSLRTTSALAVKPTTVLAISKNEFRSLFRDHLTFREMVMQTLVDRLVESGERRARMLAVERDLLGQLESLSAETERLTEAIRLRQETMRFLIHELRNPLNLVMMALAAIDKDSAYAEDADSRRFLAMASGGAQRMAGLVESLSELEQLEVARAELSLGPVNMRALVDEVVDAYRSLADASGVGLLATHEDDDLPTVNGDAGRLRQVVANLVDEGLKFTMYDKPVSVTTWQAGDTVCIAVEDGGPEVPPEQREHVFDRFGQTEKENSRSRRGVGMAYCHSALKAHGGRIWVEDSADGRGARFVFSLPAMPPEAEETESVG